MKHDPGSDDGLQWTVAWVCGAIILFVYCNTIIIPNFILPHSSP
jgi:hypothetical protein